MNWVVVSVLCFESTRMLTEIVVPKKRLGASEMTVST